jgi:hypothetical protein
VSPLSQKTVSDHIDEADSTQNIEPILAADVFVEDTSEGESVNGGELLNPDTHLEPSPNSEPCNEGEYLDSDSRLGKGTAKCRE